LGSKPGRSDTDTGEGNEIDRSLWRTSFRVRIVDKVQRSSNFSVLRAKKHVHASLDRAHQGCLVDFRKSSRNLPSSRTELGPTSQQRSKGEGADDAIGLLIGSGLDPMRGPGTLTRQRGVCGDGRWAGALQRSGHTAGYAHFGQRPHRPAHRLLSWAATAIARIILSAAGSGLPYTSSLKALLIISIKSVETTTASIDCNKYANLH